MGKNPDHTHDSRSHPGCDLDKFTKLSLCKQLKLAALLKPMIDNNNNDDNDDTSDDTIVNDKYSVDKEFA
eukprot:m.101619 g.101619  ORF g.101619 m.101619 type:complete len:70 (+) comp13748_c0_seq1:1314-1523(+)